MFDIPGMMQTLSQYIAATDPAKTHQEWADEFGISRSYFTEIVNGTVIPGTKVIRRIAEVTRGAVPPAVWFIQAGSAV